jgi:hypothetical protein
LVVLNEGLTSRVVTWAVEQHVLDGVVGGGGGRVDRGGAGVVGARGVDGVSVCLGEALLVCTRTGAVEEEAGAALGLSGVVVSEVEGEARAGLAGGEGSGGGVGDWGRVACVLLGPGIDGRPSGGVTDVEGGERLGEGGGVADGGAEVVGGEVGLAPGAACSRGGAPERGAQ